MYPLSEFIQPLKHENEQVYGRKEVKPTLTKEIIEYGYDPNEDVEEDQS
jgi:hypothetical protein